MHCSSLTPLLFELVKLNLLFCCCGNALWCQTSSRNRGKDRQLSKQDPQGQLWGCSLQGQGVFTIHLNIAGDEAVLGVNEGLYGG